MNYLKLLPLNLMLRSATCQLITCLSMEMPLSNFKIEESLICDINFYYLFHEKRFFTCCLLIFK